ncbi:hypothetical protein [Campylobacter hominis]
MQDDEKYKKIKEELDRLHKQKQNSKENLNSQTLDNNKTINNQNLNLKNINLSNSKDNLNNQSYLQNNANQNFKNSDNDLNFNKNKSSSNSINQRDYDKNPIVIKDNIMLNPFRKIIFIIWQMSNRTPEYFLNLIRYYKDSKNLEICFYNDKIQKKYKNTILLEIKTTEILNIFKTINYSFPIKYYESDIMSKKIAIFMGIFILFSIAILKSFPIVLLIVGFFTVLFLFVQNLLHSNSKVEFFYDVLFIKGKKYDFINFMINSESEYKELKQYFQIKTGKNLDKVEKKITTLFEFNKQDFQ